MRKRFKILYPMDHKDESLRGTKYKPPDNHMIVVNSDGIFFLYCNDNFYPSIKKLSEVLHKYDVVWS